MNRRWTGHADLGLVVALALLALAAVLLNLSPLVRLALALPVIFVGPGYVLHEALMAKQDTPRLEQLVITLGGSIVVSILLGLLIAALPIPLGPASWAAAIALFTVTGALVAIARRGPMADNTTHASLPAMRRRDVAAIALAAGATLVVLVGARTIIANQEPTPPALLWLLPADDGSLDAELGVRADGDGGAYMIRLTSAGEVLGEFDTVLGPQETWRQLVVFSAEQRSQPIVGRLYEDGSTTELRFVVLQPPPDAI